MRAFALAGLTAGVMALAACVGATTRFHTLDPVTGAAPAYAAAYAGAPVRIDAVHVPAGLDRLELVDVAGPNTVKVRDLDHWAAPLGELARRAITQDLASRLPQGAVVFPDSPKPPGARGIVVDMLAFDAGAGDATLEASWTLTPTVRGGPLRQHPVRLTAPGVGDQAAALSALLGQLSDTIATDLTASPPEPAIAPVTTTRTTTITRSPPRAPQP